MQFQSQQELMQERHFDDTYTLASKNFPSTLKVRIANFELFQMIILLNSSLFSFLTYSSRISITDQSEHKFNSFEITSPF